MLTWIADIYYLLIELPGKIWHATFGRNLVGKWWYSHY